MARGREPLSRERLLDAAVSLADERGLDAVTMRGLAAAVGVEAMSLYHHLPGKQGVLDALVDAVMGEVDAELRGRRVSEGSDWRESVRERFLAARAVMLRHPWAPGLISTRTSVPASVYGLYEGLLAVLVDGGFSYHLAHQALHSFGSMPLGFVQELFSPTASGGSTDVELSEAELAEMAEALPHVTAMVQSEIHANDGDVLGWCDSDTEFRFTLDLLLDGLARRLGPQ